MAKIRSHLLLRSRGYRYLYLSHSVSRLGDWVFLIAFSIWIYDQTHSPAMTALSSAAMAVPKVVLGPLTGPLADRWSKIKILVGCDLGRVVLLALLFNFKTVDHLGLILILISGVSTLGVLFSVSRRVVLGQILEPQDLRVGCSLMEITDSTLTVAGPSLGALILTKFGFNIVVAVNAFSFLCSALLLWPLLGLEEVKTTQSVEGHSFFRSLMDGIRFLSLSSDHVLIGVFMSLLSFANGILIALQSSFALKYVGLTEVQFGNIVSLQGVGGVLGAAVLSTSAKKWKISTFLGFSSALAVLGVCLPLCFPGFWSVAVSTFFEGIFITSIFVAVPVFLTENTPPSFRGRAFASLDSVEQFFTVVSMAAAGLMLTFTSLKVVYSVAILVLSVAVLLCGFYSRKIN